MSSSITRKQPDPTGWAPRGSQVVPAPSPPAGFHTSFSLKSAVQALTASLATLPSSTAGLAMQGLTLGVILKPVPCPGPSTNGCPEGAG